ncbi:OmpA family protein [Myxococcota bacterium]
MKAVMLRKRNWLVGSVVLLGVLSGCGVTLPPKELVSARRAFKEAQEARAAELSPVQLEEARQALARAEVSFEDEGDASVTRYTAYQAERRALSARSAASAEAAKQARAKSEQELRNLQAGYQEATETKLAKTRAQLEKEAAEKAKTKEQLEAERKARLAAESKLSAALASLEQIAKVKEEARGVVITLSGSVLFATGKWELLAMAQNRLDDVAKALKDQGYKHIVVEGHTDSRGSEQANLDLSKRRAEAVRSYLVGRGIDANKIEAKGIGEARAVADNASADGRANNRRVELVVTPE